MNIVSNVSARIIGLAIVAAAIAACQRDGERSSTVDSPAMAGHADSSRGMSGMAGMGGMMSAGMMDSMQVHMRMMDTMTGDRMKEMLPRHRQMAANTLSQMNSEMRSMNVAAGREWQAVVDSIRQDLIRMPEMGARELEAMMPGHHARMTRLMQMHRDMMGRMKP